MSDWPPKGEFSLIEQLVKRLPHPTGAGVVGAGDDCALLPVGEEQLLLTCDIAVDGQHFRSDLVPLDGVGFKAATANASDVIACGGKPTQALLSLGVPNGFSATALEALYEGLAEGARHYGFEVLGGNTTRTDMLLLDVFMLGHTQRFVPRSGAKPGDLLAVGGPLGDSAAGLELLLGTQPPPLQHPLVQRHLRPVARVELADWVATHASAAIDISDGLGAELHHIAHQSRVACHVEGARIPLSAELKAHAASMQKPPLDWALRSGEEYQLLVAFEPKWQPSAEAAGLVVVGEVLEAPEQGPGVWLNGQPLPVTGWDHLASKA